MDNFKKFPWIQKIETQESNLQKKSCVCKLVCTWIINATHTVMKNKNKTGKIFKVLLNKGPKKLEKYV